MLSGGPQCLWGTVASQGSRGRGGHTVTLTGDGGAVARLVGHEQLVLEAAAPHALGADEHQGFPTEGRHPRHLLVDEQLVAVKLCPRDGGGPSAAAAGTPGWPQDPHVALGPLCGTGSPSWHRDPHVAQGPLHGPGTPMWLQEPPHGPETPHGPGTPPRWPKDPHVAPGPPPFTGCIAHRRSWWSGTSSSSSSSR